MPSRPETQPELRVAVITPYYRESLEMLQFCHDSVRTQTYPCTHFLVADGHARPEISGWAVQHLILPQAHGDDGNTPRCLGSLSAMKQGFDVITYLDADNWYYPNHIDASWHCTGRPARRFVRRRGPFIGPTGR